MILYDRMEKTKLINLKQNKTKKKSLKLLSNFSNPILLTFSNFFLTKSVPFFITNFLPFWQVKVKVHLSENYRSV